MIELFFTMAPLLFLTALIVWATTPLWSKHVVENSDGSYSLRRFSLTRFQLWEWRVNENRDYWWENPKFYDRYASTFPTVDELEKAYRVRNANRCPKTPKRKFVKLI